MASLKDDPKVQDLIDKAVTKAVAAETKRCISVVKDAVSLAASTAEEKPIQRVLTAFGKTAIAALKQPVDPLG